MKIRMRFGQQIYKLSRPISWKPTNVAYFKNLLKGRAYQLLSLPYLTPTTNGPRVAQIIIRKV